VILDSNFESIPRAGATLLGHARDVTERGNRDAIRRLQIFDAEGEPAILAAVSGPYWPLQNRDAFRFHEVRSSRGLPEGRLR
jgi:hypothetical protein